MVSPWAPAARQIIQPERQIRQRTNIKRPPQVGRKQRVVVKMKRAPQASAKCDDSGEEENPGLPRNSKADTNSVTKSVAKKPTPPKLVPRPKTAADRAARVRKILDLLDQMYPEVKVPLHHANAWELLVATILSAQCTDKRVNEVTPGLFRKYPTMADFANANQAELAQDIRSTGFFNNKAKSLIGAARKILSDYGGEVPRTMKELLAIPGAARKTANVVLGGAFGVMEGIVVDTHVQRLSQRLDLTKHTQPVQIEQDLIKIIPREKWFVFPLQLIYHGRALCIARKPKCADCKLDPICYAKDKNLASSPSRE
jgi:endonuclease III